MKIRILPLLMLVLFLVFAIVSVSGGRRNDPPQAVQSARETQPPETAQPAAPTSVPAEAESEPEKKFIIVDDGEHATVDASWFDDAAFVGDSVSLKLSYYAAATGALGNAQFFASGSLGCASAMWELDNPYAVHPSYQGETMLTEDCVARSGAKKLFIMFGMNDLAVNGIDETVENYQTLLERILSKCPDIEIYVQSMTPTAVTTTLENAAFRPESIQEYNYKLWQMCQQRGWHFVNVASAMCDESGDYLRSDYCSDADDMGVHFTETGCQAWVDYLYTHSA